MPYCIVVPDCTACTVLTVPSCLDPPCLQMSRGKEPPTRGASYALSTPLASPRPTESPPAMEGKEKASFRR